MSFNVLASMEDFTVVSEYEPEKQNATAYQSEDELEREFISRLQLQGYEYLKINEEKDLINNLRKQLEKLNNISFTDNEWNEFYSDFIANPNDGIIEKTRTIQEDYIKAFKREDGTLVNIKLIDKDKLHNNSMQVINQYEVTGKRDNRYDVTILVNGLPLVHSELKRRGVSIKEAFNQINRYQRDSFWAGTGLYEYVQIFVISNGTYTKYYSNTTRNAAIKTKIGETKQKVSNTFEFTSYWADANNKPIYDLIDFAKTFLSKHTILNVLTKYCIFTSEQNLMVLRSYQIVAVERILNRIQISTNYNKLGKKEAGAYLWHTTGSGKTLSSFVASQLASKIDYIDKVIFVVDRKDLDSQTIKEYEKFQKGAVNGNNSTTELQRQLEDKDSKGNYHEYKIIVTTIQKMGIFVKKNPKHPVYDKHVVLIFDECHRSQFGELHKAIEKSFKKYHMFGFTGTPIVAKNSGNGNDKNTITTEQVFGDRLHSYTIIDAIRDNNVLPFSVDYVNTFKVKDGIKDTMVEDIKTKDTLNNPERIASNVKYILAHYNQKTKRNEVFTSKGKVMKGFNSILACESIKMANLYYAELKKQIKERGLDLKIATIYSYSANGDEEQFDTSGLSESNRDTLEDAIRDYNITFGTKFDTSGKEFYNYYINLTDRIRNNEVDITIVVNMLLTGFDSPVTDVLWVDKNLEMHGLIQAFSRTNRILNSVKTFGKIVCFRNLRDNVDEALALYGDADANGLVILRPFSDYLSGYDDNGKHIKGYSELVDDMQMKYPIPVNLTCEEDEKDFIRLFGAILRARNILSSFDQFEMVKDSLLTERDLQNYQSTYISLKENYKRIAKEKKEDIYDDIEFETELVEQVSINIDYILHLIEKYHKSNCEDKDIILQINLAIGSSPQLRSKKDLIEAFYNSVNINPDKIGSQWIEFVKDKMNKELDEIIKSERLKPSETKKFMSDCFDNGFVKTTGVEINNIMPPLSRFYTYNRDEKKEHVLDVLQEYFDKYSNLFS